MFITSVLLRRRAGDVSADNVALVAIHGTGTPLGDPIEAGALGQALGGAAGRRGGGSGKQPARPLAALSNKACYGHTEGTAGITGLLLALQVSPSSIVFVSGQLNCLADNTYQ